MSISHLPKHIFTQTFPVAMGYLPLGMTFGVLCVAQGTPWYFAVLMSVLVYAGALQMLAATFLATQLPLWEVAVMSVMINFRHVFYALSYPFHCLPKRWQRLYAAFGLTDETYSLITSQKTTLSSQHILWITAFNHMYWITGSLIGALIASHLPTLKGWEFSLTALFIVLLYEQLRHSHYPIVLGYGIVAAVFAMLLLPNQFLLVAFAALLLFLAGDWHLHSRTLKFRSQLS